MTGPWPLVPLGNLMRSIARETIVEPTLSYRLLGVRLDGHGPFLRETVLGTESSATRLNQVKTGDFIYSRLFAWRGAFGIIDETLDGCYVSNEFPTFEADRARLDSRFLLYWFQLPSVLRRVEADCTGSTPLTRNRYKEQFFLSLQVPLPPLQEQQRIVTGIESISGRIAEARRLRREVNNDSRSLLVAMAHRADLDDKSKLAYGWRKVRLSEVMRLSIDLHDVAKDRAYENLGIYSFAKGLFHKPPIDGALTSARTLQRVREGQFIYSRLFAFEGAYGMVTSEFDGIYTSNEYPTFDCDLKNIRPEFLVAYTLSQQVWMNFAKGSKGLGNRRQRLQPDRLIAHDLWLPPMYYQDKILAPAAITGVIFKGLMDAFKLYHYLEILSIASVQRMHPRGSQSIYDAFCGVPTVAAISNGTGNTYPASPGCGYDFPSAMDRLGPILTTTHAISGHDHLSALGPCHSQS